MRARCGRRTGALSPSSRRGARIGTLELVNDVYLVRPDDAGDSERRRLTNHDLPHAYPSFSPDGTRIATLAVDERIVPSFSRLAVLDAGTGEQTVLTAAMDRQCAPYPGARAPIWNGGDLLFAIEDRGDVHPYRIPVGGGEAERLFGGTRVVTGYDLAAGTFAFVATTPTTLPELFVRRDDVERQLTSVGSAFHAAVAPAEPEHFTVPSPKGDDDIDAWLIRPIGGAEGERVPMLLSIHGGPTTQYANAWFDEFQLWARAGYAVVYCNPHGSTGRTEAWTREVRSPEAPQEPGTG